MVGQPSNQKKLRDRITSGTALWADLKESKGPAGTATSPAARPSAAHTS
eukprot:CAMPEP_0177248442 /NCGR_PEP_ID=MMETSP0367-20130122/52177_1 /TAXON_ID=447022 ORGANISM="Scrippsiella hangoei-like, Strain SHHI-4" /NCGR_SAMPLE_ID=MMETSP0367 /ASSEMBLY_ACC=CAM_ASM_000362 /LENGTH=48 /DNA_ID= /DNA_START= /DNA_END= /DNA_ORIENTATION=